MDCQFEHVEGNLYKCRNCNKDQVIPCDPSIYHRMCSVFHVPKSEQSKPCIGQCVGDELKKIFDTLGIQPSARCDCESIRLAMNAAGPDLCEQMEDHFLQRLKKNFKDNYTLGEKIKVGIACVAGDRVSLKGMYREAIATARKQEILTTKAPSVSRGIPNVPPE